jgi:hypothetical protein
MKPKADKWPSSGRIEEIHWNDHMGSSGWAKPEDYQDTASTCRSVGYLLSEDKTCVRLVQSADSYCGKVDKSAVIMKKTIISRKVIRRR